MGGRGTRRRAGLFAVAVLMVVVGILLTFYGVVEEGTWPTWPLFLAGLFLVFAGIALGARMKRDRNQPE